CVPAASIRVPARKCCRTAGSTSGTTTPPPSSPARGTDGSSTLRRGGVSRTQGGDWRPMRRRSWTATSSSRFRTERFEPFEPEPLSPLNLLTRLNLDIVDASHIDAHGERVIAAAEDDSANRADVAVVAAPAERDVRVDRQQVVRRIDIKPTEARTKDLQP